MERKEICNEKCLTARSVSDAIFRRATDVRCLWRVSVGRKVRLLQGNGREDEWVMGGDGRFWWRFAARRSGESGVKWMASFAAMEQIFWQAE